MLIDKILKSRCKYSAAQTEKTEINQSYLKPVCIDDCIDGDFHSPV